MESEVTNKLSQEAGSSQEQSQGTSKLISWEFKWRAESRRKPERAGEQLWVRQSPAAQILPLPAQGLLICGR